MIPTHTKAFILADPPGGEVQTDTFKLEVQPLPKLQENEVLLKTIALDNLPSLRSWIDAEIDPKRLYTDKVNKGDVVRAFGIGEVIESRSEKYKKGMKVVTLDTLGWRQYAVIHEMAIMAPAAEIPGHSEYVSLSTLGVNAMTAYHGVFNEMKLKKESTLLVSGAAGSVGSLVIQMAKNVIGCAQVIGIAGGKEKCEYVKSLGVDECLDYKAEDFEMQLSHAIPDGVDYFFDSIGGAILDSCIPHVKRYGYICVNGAISGYNGNSLVFKNWDQVIFNRITLKGMIVADMYQDFPKAAGELVGWIIAGKIGPQKEMVVETKFEDIPKVWEMLFKGENKGKLITKLI